MLWATPPLLHPWFCDFFRVHTLCCSTSFSHQSVSVNNLRCSPVVLKPCEKQLVDVFEFFRSLATFGFLCSRRVGFVFFFNMIRLWPDVSYSLIAWCFTPFSAAAVATLDRGLGPSGSVIVWYLSKRDERVSPRARFTDGSDMFRYVWLAEMFRIGLARYNTNENFTKLTNNQTRCHLPLISIIFAEKFVKKTIVCRKICGFVWCQRWHQTCHLKLQN